MANETEQTPAATEDKPKPPKGYKQAENVGAGITASIDELLDVADDLTDEREALAKRQTANRDMLRGFVAQNLATPEQAGEILAKYPARERKAKSDTPAK